MSLQMTDGVKQTLSCHKLPKITWHWICQKETEWTRVWLGCHLSRAIEKRTQPCSRQNRLWPCSRGAQGVITEQLAFGQWSDFHGVSPGNKSNSGMLKNKTVLLRKPRCRGWLSLPCLFCSPVFLLQRGLVYQQGSVFPRRALESWKNVYSSF